MNGCENWEQLPHIWGKIKGRHKQKINAHLEMKSLVSGNVEFSSRRDIWWRNEEI